MAELMDTFYNCVSKAIAEDILNEDGEYLIRANRHENEVKRLSAGLDNIIASRVDELLAEQLVIGELR